MRIIFVISLIVSVIGSRHEKNENVTTYRFRMPRLFDVIKRITSSTIGELIFFQRKDVKRNQSLFLYKSVLLIEKIKTIIPNMEINVVAKLFIAFFVAISKLSSYIRLPQTLLGNASIIQGTDSNLIGYKSPMESLFNAQ